MKIVLVWNLIVSPGIHSISATSLKRIQATDEDVVDCRCYLDTQDEGFTIVPKPPSRDELGAQRWESPARTLGSAQRYATRSLEKCRMPSICGGINRVARTGGGLPPFYRTDNAVSSVMVVPCLALSREEHKKSGIVLK